MRHEQAYLMNMQDSKYQQKSKSISLSMSKHYQTPCNCVYTKLPPKFQFNILCNARVWLNEHKRDKCWTSKKERYKSDPRKKSKDPNNEDPDERDETTFPCSICQSDGVDTIFDTSSALMMHSRQSHENQVASLEPLYSRVQKKYRKFRFQT